MHSFQKEKGQGLDGWPITFYLGLYDILGKDLMYVVEDLSLDGHIHASINSTFISLIPKMDKPLSDDDFWLISLCNCL